MKIWMNAIAAVVGMAYAGAGASGPVLYCYCQGSRSGDCATYNVDFEKCSSEKPADKLTQEAMDFADREKSKWITQCSDSWYFKVQNGLVQLKGDQTIVKSPPAKPGAYWVSASKAP